MKTLCSLLATAMVLVGGDVWAQASNNDLKLKAANAYIMQLGKTQTQMGLRLNELAFQLQAELQANAALKKQLEEARKKTETAETPETPEVKPEPENK